MNLNLVIQECIHPPFHYENSFSFHKQFKWAGSMILLATGNTQVPFTASNSDDVFAPTSGRPTPQPQFFIPNSLPFHNNNTYNHFPDHFCTPTCQGTSLAVCTPLYTLFIIHSLPSFHIAYIHLLLFGYHLNLSCSQ